MGTNQHNSQQTKLPIYLIFPNIVTIIGLCFGLSSIKYALNANWEYAVGLLVISAFIDGMDGRLARILNASSKFGAELDSLTDFVNFGVTPTIITYSWSLHNFPIKGVGWSIAMLFTITMALRLARFNSELDDNNNKTYFSGIPAPCSAGLTMVPIMLSFQYDIFIFQTNPSFYILYILIIVILTASSIPTISLKNVNIDKNYFIPLMLFFTLFIIALITEPWITLPFMGLLYIITLAIYPLICNRKFSTK